MRMTNIFENQKELQKKLKGISLPSKNSDFIRESALGVFTELGEALAVDKSWKTWRNNFNDFNEEDLKEEIADVWIFLINYTLANNIDFDEISKIILNKQKKNFKRFL